MDALLQVRAQDTDSWLFARENGWRYPVSREWILAADQYDLAGRAQWGKKWKKGYPRPWPKAGAKRSGKHSLSTGAAMKWLRRAKAGELAWHR